MRGQFQKIMPVYIHNRPSMVLFVSIHSSTTPHNKPGCTYSEVEVTGIYIIIIILKCCASNNIIISLIILIIFNSFI